jgi:hypothetical protein
MYYAQFFTAQAEHPIKLVEACGDQAVIILDGRRTIKSMHDTARDWCIRRRYDAYQIRKAEALNRPLQKKSNVVKPQGF